MQFLRGEVESDIRLTIAKRGVTYDDEDSYKAKRKHPKITFEHTTATDLLKKEKTSTCIFREGTHNSQDVFKWKIAEAS